MDMWDNIYVSANGNGDSTILGSLSFNHRIHPTIDYAQDIYLAKLNSNGQEIWLRNGGSDAIDEVTDIATDKWGNTILSVYSSQQSLSGLIFENDTIPQWHGGLVKYDNFGNLLYSQKLQEARTLQALAMSEDSVFYGTGNGFNPGLPYLNLSITQCEDSVNGYYNPPYRMIMVKFYDESGNFTTSTIETEKNDGSTNVFPNPTNQFLNLHFKNNHNQKHLEVFDIAGIARLSQTTSNDLLLNIEFLPEGLYILRVTEGANVETIKFVKN